MEHGHRQDSQASGSRSHAEPGRGSAFPRRLSAMVGNQGLLHWAAARGLQPKLEVSRPDDPYEIEADRVADEIMRQPLGPPQPLRATGPVVQRRCAACSDEAERLQPKGDVGVADEVGDDLEAEIRGLAGRGQPLPPALRADLEPRFSADLGLVRVHTDTQAQRLAGAVNAQAFTVGRDVVFGAGRYAPETPAGRHLLAHELTHVVQQGGASAGPVAARLQRRVDEVTIDCADNHIRFQHDGATTAYALNHCDVSDGAYDATVRIRPGHVDFDLGDVPGGSPRFDFGYDIAPGQPNPETFFRGQRTVRIVATGGAPASADEGSVRFNVRSLSAEELRALAGLGAASLPEGRLVPLSSAAAPGLATTAGTGRRPLASMAGPAGAGAAYFSPTPFSFLPANSTGVLWTPNHASVFANPRSALLPTLRGYRGWLGYHMASGMGGDVGTSFTVRLHEGVPGSFADDALFPLRAGEQSYLYVIRDAAEAARFAERLRTTEYGGTYTYTPPRAVPDPILGPVGRTEAELYQILMSRGRAPMCTNNCVTVPGAEIEAAIGMRPTTPGGVDVMSGTAPDGTVNPAYVGRGRLMSEAMSEGPLAPGVGRLNITVTPGGSASMFLIRGGGRVLLVYGIYHTSERLLDAAGTPALPTVLAEETGSWAGGILGSALGGAAAGALLCAPTGPVDAVCVVGGFLGGLLMGGATGAVGSELGHAAVEGRPPEGGIIDTVTSPVTEGLGELHGYLEFNIRRLYGYGLPY